MSRIPVSERDALPAASQDLLAGVEKRLGRVPNMLQEMALSPAVLQAYLGMSAALGKALDLKTRERIAIALAEANGCDYCRAAHHYLGVTGAKLDETEAALNRQGTSSDPKSAVAVAFALKLAKACGQVSDADIDAARGAGFSDAQIMEIVAVVAENLFTNFINIVAETDVDFPPESA